MRTVVIVLWAIGYPVAIFVIVRWINVVNERRVGWFAAHTAAVALITTGWIIEGSIGGIAINASWLVISILWYGFGARKRKRLSDLDLPPPVEPPAPPLTTPSPTDAGEPSD